MNQTSKNKLQNLLPEENYHYNLNQQDKSLGLNQNIYRYSDSMSNLFKIIYRQTKSKYFKK